MILATFRNDYFNCPGGVFQEIQIIREIQKSNIARLKKKINLLIGTILLQLLLMLIYRLSEEKKQTGTWHMMQRFVWIDQALK